MVAFDKVVYAPPQRRRGANPERILGVPGQSGFSLSSHKFVFQMASWATKAQAVGFFEAIP